MHSIVSRGCYGEAFATLLSIREEVGCWMLRALQMILDLLWERLSWRSTAFARHSSINLSILTIPSHSTTPFGP